jgi:hypothetical protein
MECGGGGPYFTAAMRSLMLNLLAACLQFAIETLNRNADRFATASN